MTKGLLELRKAISEYIFNRYQTLYNPEREILVTNGGSEGIDSVLRTILNAGDEVILPSPTYLGYEPIIKLLGCHVKLIDTTDTNFKVTEKKLDKLLQNVQKRLYLIIHQIPLE